MKKHYNGMKPILGREGKYLQKAYSFIEKTEIRLHSKMVKTPTQEEREKLFSQAQAVNYVKLILSGVLSAVPFEIKIE